MSMKLSKTLTAIALAVAASASMADTFTGPIDLSSGNAIFGRSDATGAFTDTYTFTLGASSLLNGTGTSVALLDQDLDFTSLVIQTAANVTVASFAGNLGTDMFEFYTLAPTALAAGSYKLVVTGINSVSRASYAGTLAVAAAPVPEPETYALLLAGLGAVGFVASRRKV
jgi:hypothetical protein